MFEFVVPADMAPISTIIIEAIVIVGELDWSISDVLLEGCSEIGIDIIINLWVYSVHHSIP